MVHGTPKLNLPKPKLPYGIVPGIDLFQSPPDPFLVRVPGNHEHCRLANILIGCGGQHWLVRNALWGVSMHRLKVKMCEVKGMLPLFA